MRSRQQGRDQDHAAHHRSVPVRSRPGAGKNKRAGRRDKLPNYQSAPTGMVALRGIDADCQGRERRRGEVDLDAFRYRHMMTVMARAATTSDVSNAIAEPQRREILVLLRAGERPVTELARELGMAQPRASKHLRVLREVGLVRDRKAGKQRLYDLDARGLRPVHEWTGGFERFWNESFDRLDAYVQDLKQGKSGGVAE